jgi:hypothetical protein
VTVAISDSLQEVFLHIAHRRTLDELVRLQPLIEIAARERRQRPGLPEPLQRVLAEDGARAESAARADGPRGPALNAQVPDVPLRDTA